MRMTIRILAITAVALALSTAYLVRSLMLEKSKTASLIAGAATPRAGGVQAAASGAAVGTAAGDTPSGETDSLDGAARLAIFRDPAARRDRVARTRTSLGNAWAPRAVAMQLQPYELDGFLDTLAEQTVAFDQRRAECRVDPACDSRALEMSLRAERQKNLPGQLGAENFAKYDAWLYAIPERLYVREIASDFPPASQFTGEQEERFVMAMAEQRRLFIEGAASAGRRISVSQFLVREAQGDAPANAIRDPLNDAMTKDFNAKLRRRAADLLTGPQLAAFNAFMDERVASGRLFETLITR